MIDLGKVWSQQDQYNAKVMARQIRPSAEWMETYILGLMSECGQLLEAMRWKKNRLQSVEEFGPNVPEELADITKFVFSMWILLGAQPQEMLDLVYQKGELLSSLWEQEFEARLNTKVVIFDLDNVLAELQGALAEYMALAGFDLESLQANIHLDLAANQRFDEYRALKNRFELEGGYRKLESLFPVKPLFAALREAGFSIVVYTARPVEVFKRIRKDTLAWFLEQGSLPDHILYGREERIVFAASLLERGHQVTLVEDDPGIVRRAQVCKIPVVVPMRPYNRTVANFNGTEEDLVAVICSQEEMRDDGRETWA